MTTTQTQTPNVMLYVRCYCNDQAIGPRMPRDHRTYVTWDTAEQTMKETMAEMRTNGYSIETVHSGFEATHPALPGFLVTVLAIPYNLKLVQF